MIVRMRDFSMIENSFVVIEFVHTVSTDKQIDDTKLSVISFYDQKEWGKAFKSITLFWRHMAT